MFCLFGLLAYISYSNDFICYFDNCDLKNFNLKYEINIGDKIILDNNIYNIETIKRSNKTKSSTHLAWKLKESRTDPKYTCPNDKGTGCHSTGAINPIVTHNKEECERYYADDKDFKPIYEKENIKYIKVELKEDIGTRHKNDCGFNPSHNKANSICLDWLSYFEILDEKDYNVNEYENYELTLVNERDINMIIVNGEYNRIIGIFENDKIIENFEKVAEAIRYEDDKQVNGFKWFMNDFIEVERTQDLFINKPIPYLGGGQICHLEYNKCNFTKVIKFNNDNCKNCDITYEVNDFPCDLNGYITYCNIINIFKETCVNITFDGKLYCEEKRSIIEDDDQSHERKNARPDNNNDIIFNKNSHTKTFLIIIVILIVIIVALGLVLSLVCSCVVGVILLKFLI